MILQLPKIIIEHRIRGLCSKPYHGHPRGCPNFAQKPGCPPNCPMFNERFDLSQPTFAIINEFDLRAHVKRMAATHPHWSERQLECCLYWQGRARGQLARIIRGFLVEYPQYVADVCPEAGGVNVTETLARVGLQLEWPPKRIVRQVAIVVAKIGEERIAVVEAEPNLFEPKAEQLVLAGSGK